MTTTIALRQGEFWRKGDEYLPVSEGSRTIDRARQDTRNFLSNSASDWIPTIEGALRAIREDRFADNLEGAAPVTDGTIELAERIAISLFEMLPKGTAVPDLMAEQDGEICLSWMVDDRRIFALSIGDHKKINFAGQFGKMGEVHAWQPIDTTSKSALESSLGDVARYVTKLFPPVALVRSSG